MLVALLVVDGVEIVTTIVAVVADTAMNLMVVDATVVAEMTETEAIAAVIVTIITMLLVESTVMPDPAMVPVMVPAMVTVTAEEVTNAVEEDTKTVTDTIEVVVMRDQLETRLLRLPMVIKLLVEMLESHTEVEPTMMTNTPVVNINC